LLKFEGLTSESDTIYTNIQINGPKLVNKPDFWKLYLRLDKLPASNFNSVFLRLWWSCCKTWSDLWERYCFFYFTVIFN